MKRGGEHELGLATVEKPRPEVAPEPTVAHEMDDVGFELVQVLPHCARREPDQRNGVEGHRALRVAGQPENRYAVRHFLPVRPGRLRDSGERVLGCKDADRLDRGRLLNLVREFFDGAFDSAQVGPVVRRQVQHTQRCASHRLPPGHFSRIRLVAITASRSSPQSGSGRRQYTPTS